MVPVVVWWYQSEVQHYQSKARCSRPEVWCSWRWFGGTGGGLVLSVRGLVLAVRGSVALVRGLVLLAGGSVFPVVVQWYRW